MNSVTRAAYFMEKRTSFHIALVASHRRILDLSLFELASLSPKILLAIPPIQAPLWEKANAIKPSRLP